MEQLLALAGALIIILLGIVGFWIQKWIKSTDALTLAISDLRVEIATNQVNVDSLKQHCATRCTLIDGQLNTQPTLGLFAEREPEIVIDGPTTRNIMANFPEILGAINAARVGQFAGGKYPEIGGVSTSNSQMIGLLQANLQMMREVRDSHKRPALVSFQSLRERQREYDAIKSRTSIQ